jgi:hypothetical protein
VLRQDPTERTALYNRALALHLESDKEAETKAWKEFLDHYRTGVWAYRAMGHLYDNGDYSFRSYPVGSRSVILNQDRLLGPATPERDHELRYLADQIAAMGLRAINIIVFRRNDEAGARQTARALRDSLLARLDGQGRDTEVIISWFGEPESMELDPDTKINVPQGVMIFTTPEHTRQEERI